MELPASSFTPAEKRAISLEDLKRLSTFSCDGEEWKIKLVDFAKDVFLLSFGLMGMNAADLYNSERYENGRIVYERTKTKTRRADRALISVKVEPEVMPLFEKYRDPSGERVFCFHKKYASAEYFSNRLMYGMQAIKAALGLNCLTFYSARHTWATIAVNEAGVDKYAVHSALNHVDPMMKVTDMYIKKSWAVNDEANRKVLDYVKIFDAPIEG